MYCVLRCPSDSAHIVATSRRLREAPRPHLHLTSVDVRGTEWGNFAPFGQLRGRHPWTWLRGPTSVDAVELPRRRCTARARRRAGRAQAFGESPHGGGRQCVSVRRLTASVRACVRRCDGVGCRCEPGPSAREEAKRETQGGRATGMTQVAMWTVVALLLWLTAVRGGMRARCGPAAPCA